MVLKIFNNSNVYVYKDIDSTFFRTRSYGGMMYLQFDISTKHSLYKYLIEETRLEYDRQFYLVKGINERNKSGISTINAELDLTGLESKVYTSKIFKTESFYNVCSEILRDTNWNVTNADLINKRTTLEISDSTPRQILDQCTNTTAFGTCYEFNTKIKTITLIKPENNTEPTGCYFTDELNLSELTFKGSSASLITKLYVYGKDGLSISSVNGGKDYIENHSYTNKVITAVWRDERYTDAQSLYDDAVAKLNALAVPQRSYICKVVDLAKLRPDIYGNILNYDLYDVVTLIDRNRNTRINHRIVEIKEYPADATLNTVTLSTIAGKVTGKITTLDNKLTQLDAQQLHDRTKVNEIKQDLDTTVLHISESWASSVNQSLFTQTAEGLFLQVDKIVGTNRWSTLLQQSASDVQISWNNISNYIKFENSQLNIYNILNKKVMSLHSGGQNVYDSDGSLLMSLNSSGQDFYYKNNRVGWIGTGCWANDSSKRDLSFNLENSATFMDWCYKKNADDKAYTLIFTYAAKKLSDSYEANQLHAGCDINLHNYNIRNAVLKDWNISGGSISGTFSGYCATSYSSDGTANAWRSFSLTFKNGILTSATW